MSQRVAFVDFTALTICNNCKLSAVKCSKQTIMKNEVIIDGITYVLKVQPNLETAVIVRSESAGVFFGYKKSETESGVVVLTSARRLWYWAGAASISQLAVSGTSKPTECKFPVVVPEITIFKVIEIIPCQPAAIVSIEGVKVWEE